MSSNLRQVADAHRVYESECCGSVKLLFWSDREPEAFPGETDIPCGDCDFVAIHRQLDEDPLQHLEVMAE